MKFLTSPSQTLWGAHRHSRRESVRVHDKVGAHAALTEREVLLSNDIPHNTLLAVSTAELVTQLGPPGVPYHHLGERVTDGKEEEGTATARRQNIGWKGVDEAKEGGSALYRRKLIPVHGSGRSTTGWGLGNNEAKDAG